MKLTSSPPYCSCCFQQKPALRHVDMEAYWDGPIIEGAGYKQPIDDLVLCEDCIRTAGELVDLSEHKKLLAQRNELLSEVKELRKYREDAEVRLHQLRELV